MKLTAMLTYLFLLEKGIDELGDVDGDLLGQLVEVLLDLILSFDPFLLHLHVNILQVLFLLQLELGFLLRVLLFGGDADLHLVLLLHLLARLVFGFGVFLLELFDFIVLLLLKLLKFLARGVDDLFDTWVDHELLHFETHF